jgi:hypothetical protein
MNVSLGRVLRLLASFLLGIALLVALWGARFHYDHIVVDGETYLVRVSRLSGYADVLIPGDGWVPAEDAWSDSDEDQPQSPS